MPKNAPLWVVVALLAIIVIQFVAMTAIVLDRMHGVRCEAVAAGVARWVPNTDGSTRFEWIRKGE